MNEKSFDKDTLVQERLQEFRAEYEEMEKAMYEDRAELFAFFTTRLSEEVKHSADYKTALAGFSSAIAEGQNMNIDIVRSNLTESYAEKYGEEISEAVAKSNGDKKEIRSLNFYTHEAWELCNIVIERRWHEQKMAAELERDNTQNVDMDRERGDDDRSY